MNKMRMNCLGFVNKTNKFKQTIKDYNSPSKLSINNASKIKRYGKLNKNKWNLFWITTSSKRKNLKQIFKKKMEKYKKSSSSISFWNKKTKESIENSFDGKKDMNGKKNKKQSKSKTSNNKN